MIDIDTKKEYTTNITNSHVFIRPIIGYNYGFYSMVTCYNTHIDLNYNIYVVYNKALINNAFKTKHNSNIEQLVNNKYYCETTSNDVFDILRFHSPNDAYYDFDRFLDSRFTQFTDTYKGQLRRFYSHDNTMLKIINDVIAPSRGKIKELADKYDVEESDIIEIKSKIDLKAEIFDIDNYSENGYIYKHYNKKQTKDNEEK